MPSTTIRTSFLALTSRACAARRSARARGGADVAASSRQRERLEVADDRARTRAPATTSAATATSTAVPPRGAAAPERAADDHRRAERAGERRRARRRSSRRSRPAARRRSRARGRAPTAAASDGRDHDDARPRGRRRARRRRLRGRRRRRSSTRHPSRPAYPAARRRSRRSSGLAGAPPHRAARRGDRCHRTTRTARLLHVPPLRPGPADGEPARAHRAQGASARCRVKQVDVDERPDLAERFRIVAGAVARARQGQARRRAARGPRRPRRRSSRCSTAPKLEALIREQPRDPLALQPRDHGEPEVGGALAVDHAMVERDRDVAHAADDDRAVAHDRRGPRCGRRRGSRPAGG